MAATDLTERRAVELLAQIGVPVMRQSSSRVNFIFGNNSYICDLVPGKLYDLYKHYSGPGSQWEYISTHSCIYLAIENAIWKVKKWFGGRSYRLSISSEELKWRVIIEDPVNLLTWHVCDDRLVGLLAESISGGEDATKILGDYVQDLQLG